MAWLDIIVMLAFVVFAFIGYKRGFLQGLIHFGCNIAVFIVSFLLAKPFGGLLNAIFGLNDAMAGAIKGTLEDICISSTGGAIDNSLMDNFARALFGDEYWLKYDDGVASAQFLNDFSNGIGKMLTMIIALVILYIVIKVTIAILNKFFKFLDIRRPVGAFGRIGGFCVGAIEGFVTIWIIFCFAYFIIPALPLYNEQITAILSTNRITNEFYTLIGEFMDGILLPWLTA